MMSVSIRGIGVCGPGLEDWPAAAAVLRAERPYEAAPMRNPAPAVLAAGERRRASLAVRLAIEVASHAVAEAGVDAARLPAVFASSDGDGETIHSICRAITEPAYPVSPTRFHNSVHNAAAGYWSIAVGSRQPSTSLCAYNDTFAVALLDTIVQASVEREPTLLVISDVASPSPLDRERPNVLPFGCALIAAPDPAPRDPRALQVRFGPGSARLQWPIELPAALLDNPAARVLILLHALALGRPAVIRLPYRSDAHLELRVGEQQ
jgi:hypothetical protein